MDSLPSTSAPFGVAGLQSTQKPGLSAADVHVLLVDDERLSRTVVSNLLRRCDYKVTTADNGAEAMELLRSHAPGTFNLVLTDVCMPEVNGIQLLQYVKQEENLRSVPVIMMSSIEQGDTVYECVSSGAEEYLVKPVTRREVQHMWQHVLRKRSALATVPQTISGELEQPEGGAGAAACAATTTTTTTAEPPLPDMQAAGRFLRLMRAAREREAAEVQQQLQELDEDLAMVIKASGSDGVSDGVSEAPRAAKRQRTDGAASSGEASSSDTAAWRAVAARLDALEPLYFERRRQNSSFELPPLDSLAKDLNVLARGSALVPCATLRAGDTACPQEMVCCADFDADDRHFATVSVSRSIKVFDFSAVLASPGALHVPVWRATTRSKLSSVSWNTYVRSQLLTSDYDGLIQLWDASVGPTAEAASFEEHSRRVWSVDFSRADPLRFVSGSDDGTVRLWSVNQERSAAVMRAPANVCSVQFSPTSPHLVAAGCANHKVYLYDLRRPDIPAAAIAGPRRAVSYVRFMGPHSLVAASTDSAVRVWSVEEALAAGASDAAGAGVAPPPRCTFTGHRNERNFVGLSATDDGYIATGSEDNSVHAYYHTLPFAVASHGMGDGSAKKSDKGPAAANASSQRAFVSSVCWARAGRHCLAANSQGVLSVLRLQ